MYPNARPSHLKMEEKIIDVIIIINRGRESYTTFPATVLTLKRECPSTTDMAMDANEMAHKNDLRYIVFGDLLPV